MATTDLQDRKVELIQWLTVVEDPELIERVARVRDEGVIDWWNEISEVERESIGRGVKDAESGKLKPHSEARAKYEKWL